MKKYILAALSVFITLFALYFGFRAWSTYQANRDTDSFFADFRASKDVPSDKFRFLSQSEPEAKSIISRNSESIHNFSYETTKPTLNLALNETDIGVSWHLNIRFVEHSGHWYPAYFDEYIPNSPKAEQGAAANP
jgi:hypothetical protein